MIRGDKDEFFKFILITALAFVVLMVSSDTLIQALSSYDKVEAVVADKEYISGGRSGVYLMVLSYTYKGKEYRHIVDMHVTFLYKKGSRVVLYISPYDGDERVLSDIIIIPAVSLGVLIFSIYGTVAYCKWDRSQYPD